MLTNETISKLQDMRLGVMAKRFKEQLSDPQFASMSFEDRFSILVDAAVMCGRLPNSPETVVEDPVKVPAVDLGAYDALCGKGVAAS